MTEYNLFYIIKKAKQTIKKSMESMRLFFVKTY